MSGTSSLRMFLVAGVIAAAMSAWPAGSALHAQESLPYEVSTTAAVDTPLSEFRSSVVDTLDDPRGWSLGGSIDFTLVDEGGLFTVVLASPEEVEDAAAICSDEWSCRVGDRVLINELRWTQGTEGYPLPLDDYRDYVVNHEVGHWLGLDHRDCPGFDREAPVMMQQSKSLDRCTPTVWPIPDEQRRAGDLRGVDVARQQVLSRGDRGAGVAEWQQHLNAVAGRDLLVDGWFGPNTETATIGYQNFFGMTADGVAGEDERDLMNYVLRLQPRSLTIGMVGPDVTDWQRDLRQIGQDLVIDGWYGPQTEDRTLNIQRFFGLPLSGEADAATRGIVDHLLTVEE